MQRNLRQQLRILEKDRTLNYLSWRFWDEQYITYVLDQRGKKRINKVKAVYNCNQQWLNGRSIMKSTETRIITRAKKEIYNSNNKQYYSEKRIKKMCWISFYFISFEPRRRFSHFYGQWFWKFIMEGGGNHLLFLRSQQYIKRSKECSVNNIFLAHAERKKANSCTGFWFMDTLHVIFYKDMSEKIQNFTQIYSINIRGDVT